jgi:hypothetical protein
LTRSTVINAQLRDGWVTPKDKLVGGHLFKAEFGGPDDETNVVPWSQTAEREHGVFEKTYEAAAVKDAKILANKIKKAKVDAAKSTGTPDALATATDGFAATVTTKATFADRPDLEVSEDELTAAGWEETDPERAKRKEKFADVAERFSGIPTQVSVTVAGLSDGEKKTDLKDAEIAPDFKRNDEAIKPEYIVPVRYKRNATGPRPFSMVPDWVAIKKKNRSAEDEARLKKLNHVKDRHGDHFGVTGGSFTDLQELESKLSAFIQADSTEQIEGMYLGDEVLHYVDGTTKIWLCTTPTGELVAGFKLSEGQYNILIKQGTVG